MSSDYEILGISAGASNAEIKTAYHQKLREFPAHSFPQEFKAIRTAYENLSKGENQEKEYFLNIRPLKPELDKEVISQIKDRAFAQLNVSIEELIKATF
jgi:curved DNA-binding protein CbpA